MKRSPNFIYRVFLAIGDIVAILISFVLAFIMRVTLSSKPIVFQVEAIPFILTVTMLVPFWIITFYLLGLYDKSVYSYKPKEAGRLAVASILSVMFFISYEFVTSIPLFPAKMVAGYSLIFSFLLLFVNRSIARFIRESLLRKDIGILNTVVIGNHNSTYEIIDYLHDNPESGYKIVGIVSSNRYIPEFAKSLKYSSLSKALKEKVIDVIIQTDEKDPSSVYSKAIDNHISYMYVPSQDLVLTTKSSTDILGALPIVSVKTTTLIGHGRAFKRAFDIIMGSLFLIIASPIMLIIILAMKIIEPTGAIFFKQKRLSRYNKPVYIYKFRSMKKICNGLSPEEGFKVLGHPELAKIYRENGDQLENDPRISFIGRFLRKTSLDELPQLINVIKGDISLVGPRALVPQELADYPNKNLILSVKSGLTGLAQISGRRDISFSERRKLDIYYVQNWSMILDIQIIIKTIWMVLVRRGAK